MNKATAYKRAQVATNDRLGVLLMIHDGILKELRRARLQLICKTPAPLRDPSRPYASEKTNHSGAELPLLKAQSAIVELDRTLDFKAGPELADSLHNLYLHMILTLSDVLERSDIVELDRIIGLVERLRQTWSEAGTAARGRATGAAAK